jgi:phosphoribosylformylglycinamidine synthase subunit PurL
MLSSREKKYILKNLQRKPNTLEVEMVSAEWSEHCSYKSSKKLVRSLPTKGNRVLVGPGYDAGVLDIGNGLVITVHIESHNHPSAVDPFGGAATGVGGVIRDIISLGTRPIAILNALRFGTISSGDDSSKSRWLFKNVVKGIADYGNCIGIPNVGGEIEFDGSFDQYCIVDVAAIGIGLKKDIISNEAKVGDLIILAGNSTGRDGVRGASFASKSLVEDRSAVQIPDPFLEKLLIEAIQEAVKRRCIRAIKDLGGGGLACCLSELSDAVGMGFEVELSSIHKKFSSLSTEEIMISESQERMLLLVPKNKLNDFKKIAFKFTLPYSIIGQVRDHKDLVILSKGDCVARMKSSFLANAPLASRKYGKPTYIKRLQKYKISPPLIEDYERVLLTLLSNYTIASKKWVYQQYDNEVGLRTVVKPGDGDATVLRIDEDKFISVKLDGNSKQCYLDPYFGTLGCLSEACRNIRCTGANPIGIVDHLQFGSPERPDIFWSFKRSIEAIRHYCNYAGIPVVGGKVSFYNETNKGPIKPTPVIGAIGLIEGRKNLVMPTLHTSDSIFILGSTLGEMGGSEFFESYHQITGGKVPRVSLEKDLLHGNIILELIHSGIARCVHDCSNGGLAVSLAEMAFRCGTGISINMVNIPNNCSRLDYLLFSETHSRYLFASNDPIETTRILRNRGCSFGEIGYVNGIGSDIELKKDKEVIVKISLKDALKSYHSLDLAMSGYS